MASHLAAMIVNAGDEDSLGPDNIEGMKKKYGKLPSGPNAAKESELILEKIKSVKVERLQKAINDQVTWSLLTQDVRDGVLAEYAKLLKA